MTRAAFTSLSHFHPQLHSITLSERESSCPLPQAKHVRKRYLRVDSEIYSNSLPDRLSLENALVIFAMARTIIAVARLGCQFPLPRLKHIGLDGVGSAGDIGRKAGHDHHPVPFGDHTGAKGDLFGPFDQPVRI